MTVETRYMRNDEVLGTSQTLAHDEVTKYGTGGSEFVSWGVRIYYDGVEKTSGVYLIASRITNTSGMQSNTWDAPAGYCDVLKVEVYTRFSYGAWQLDATFQTPSLNANILAATWTIYLWTKRQYAAPEDMTYGYFRYGDSTENSRIENFTWEVVAPAVPVLDGLTWIA